jgi:Short C-terminal domain
MPGLLRGIARTAVFAGTWTAVSNGVSRRQGNRWAKQDEQAYYEQQGRAAAQAPAAPAPAPAAPAASARGEQDTITQLKELAELKSQGILTDEEFAAQKAKVLAA